MKITKRQLRRIIKEEKRKIQEQASPFQGLGEEIYSALEDIFMAYGPEDEGIGYTSPADMMAFRKSVMDALDILEDRVMDPNMSQADRMGMQRVTIGRPV